MKKTRKYMKHTKATRKRGFKLSGGNYSLMLQYAKSIYDNMHNWKPLSEWLLSKDRIHTIQEDENVIHAILQNNPANLDLLIKSGIPLPPLNFTVLETLSSKTYPKYLEVYQSNPLREPSDSDLLETFTKILVSYPRLESHIEYIANKAYIFKGNVINVSNTIQNPIALFMSKTKMSKDSQKAFNALVNAGIYTGIYTLHNRNGTESLYNPLLDALTKKRYDIAEVLIRVENTNDVPKNLLNAYVPLDTILEQSKALQKQQEDAALREKAEYNKTIHTMRTSGLIPNSLPKDSQNELRALLTYETQPMRGFIRGRFGSPNFTPMTIENRITEILHRQDPVKEEIVLWRGHQNEPSYIDSKSWFSTTKSRFIASEVFKGIKCCLFKIHVQPGVRVFDLYELYKQYGVVNPYHEQKYLKSTIMKSVVNIRAPTSSAADGRNFIRFRDYSKYQEVIVEGGGVFYTDITKHEQGFKEIEPGVFETYYFSV